ncbi:MAG: 2-oxoglutarate dehydrogenase E1 component [Planctomycetota bacterium]|jgi:2-oxoglutarate dehydrogenase E1 component
MSTGTADLSINGWDGRYVDELYQQWTTNPRSVDPQWQRFFEGFELGARPGAASATAVDIAHSKQGAVDALISHYRDIGHLAAKLDPLGVERPYPAYLRLDVFGLGEADLDERYDPGQLPLPNPSPLREIIDLLEETYCRHIGVEYMHIQDDAQREWLQQQMEPLRNRPSLSHDQRMRILRELTQADALESFLNVRYRGKKRFSLEGGESLNPMLNEIIDLGPDQGVEEITIGMAHRGRINVLVNILNKSYDQLFTEFEESWVEDFIEGGGDVKYHRGYSSDHVTASGAPIRLVLSPNPSHLEFGHAVVLGRARAKQRLRHDTERRRCVPILIHGDAAFPGQGIVAEMLNMAHLDGYTVGGTIHVVVNNQVGFTTNPEDAHSGTYCTDIAKMVEAPIFHVNGNDPEACAFAAMVALKYRQTFRNDVVIDMWCYRKYGHNESDEPMYTQPLMYQRIKQQQPVFRAYADRLVAEGETTVEDVDALSAELRRKLDESQERTKEQPVATNVDAFGSVWSGLAEKYSDDPVETGVGIEMLQAVARAIGTVPHGFHVHRRLEKLMRYRREAVDQDEPLDWAMGEMLAYGTLLLEDHAVRLTGQDVERGTFSHRHAALFDQTTGEGIVPLNHIRDPQARFCIHNSPLTESACVGFEYGYSLGDPKMLVLWEAQFGDFANGAQVIIDQFIASAEVKWQRYSGLTLLLPHGYEGQGPEHSSARLERFLTLCARDNMQVVYPTTPAQMFHVLRRQMKRSFRKPLVIMSPKSLLRHPKAVSRVDELVNDRFRHLLDDPHVPDPDRIRRLLFCSGKIYYELVAHREAAGHDDVAVVRIEQLYPLRSESVRPVLARYPNVRELVWVQEEPKNMGAWTFIDTAFRDQLDLELHYVGRERSATPAVASTKMHQEEQEQILIRALGLPAGTSRDTRGRKEPSPESRLAG